MNRIKLLAKKLLHPFGLQISRLPRGQAVNESSKSFYQPPTSCQIPELAQLYSIYLGERKTGFFVEVGAFDGITYSNSFCLAEKGWEGLLIEPIPQFADMIRKLYQGNSSIEVIQSAVGADDSFIDISIAGAMTTTRPDILEAYKEIAWAKGAVANSYSIKVPIRRLDDILETHAKNRRLDVLIVDVEGAEESVFEGFTLSRWLPKILIVELAHTHPDLHGDSQGHQLLQDRIEEEGYTIIYKDQINTVFLRRGRDTA